MANCFIGSPFRRGPGILRRPNGILLHITYFLIIYSLKVNFIHINPE